MCSWSHVSHSVAWLSRAQIGTVLLGPGEPSYGESTTIRIATQFRRLERHTANNAAPNITMTRPYSKILFD